MNVWQAHRLSEPIDNSLPLPGNTLHTTVTSSQQQLQHEIQPLYVFPPSSQHDAPHFCMAADMLMTQNILSGKNMAQTLKKGRL